MLFTPGQLGLSVYAVCPVFDYDYITKLVLDCYISLPLSVSTIVYHSYFVGVEPKTNWQIASS